LFSLAECSPSALIMLVNLFILRHGPAEEPGGKSYTGDASRPLTPDGRRKTRRVAKALADLGLSFDVIISSPYRRARQTAEIVAEKLGLSTKLEVSDSLKPGGDLKALIRSLAQSKSGLKSVLLVGHEPSLSGLISLLVGGDPGMAVVLKKAGLAKLQADTLKPGRCAALKWLLTPRQLCLIRKR
jgi:phosphohistidine phosphatase